MTRTSWGSNQRFRETHTMEPGTSFLPPPLHQSVQPQHCLTPQIPPRAYGQRFESEWPPPHTPHGTTEVSWCWQSPSPAQPLTLPA